jgi:hypothetical protein
MKYAHKSTGDHLEAQLQLIVKEELRVAALLTQALVCLHKINIQKYTCIYVYLKMYTYMNVFV